MNANDPEFLDIEDVLELHRLSLEQYGGGSGVRDLGMLESALAQPRSAFGEQYAHEGLFAMAGAYLFHIARNHPFVDGNKRTALLAALVSSTSMASLSSGKARRSTSSPWAWRRDASARMSRRWNSNARRGTAERRLCVWKCQLLPP